MKKFLILVLALVFALALTVPAMAFTSVTADEDEAVELDIYLVEFEDDEFFGIAGNPPADRGYAKNEVVAAIVEMTVPDGYGTLDSSDYVSLIFSGKNVTLSVTENTTKFTHSANVTTDQVDVLKPGVVDKKITLAIADPTDGFGDDDTYKWLFFAKVTGDEASLTAKLNANENDWTASGSSFVLDVQGDYLVEDLGNEFVVADDASKPLFSITVNDDDETKDLYVYSPVGTKYLATNPEAGVFYTLGGARVTSTSLIRDLQEVYEDEFVEAFGFDFSISSGILTRDFFEDFNGSDDIEATVEIKPWTAYVTVPDNIVVDPPKTGDAASIVGFVMIVLAAAAVVAVKKVRA